MAGGLSQTASILMARGQLSVFGHPWRPCGDAYLFSTVPPGATEMGKKWLFCSTDCKLNAGVSLGNHLSFSASNTLCIANFLCPGHVALQPGKCFQRIMAHVTPGFYGPNPIHHILGPTMPQLHMLVEISCHES
jgi:hypothetical protein